MIVEIMEIRMTEEEFWDKFNKKHNPGFRYAKKKIEKEIKKKDQKQEDDPAKFKILRK